MNMPISSLYSLLEEQSIELKTDSRLVEAGNVFIALPPAKSRHLGNFLAPWQNVQMALEKGAQFIVLQEELWLEHENILKKEYAPISFFPVKDIRAELGILASICYKTKNLDFPVIALCGTNGKTTSSYLLEHLYKATGKRVAVLGTVSYHWPGYYEDAPLTTPDCLWLHKALAKIKEAKVDALIMEISSHALDQERIAGIPISGAIFTNLSQDHLDYHENMENYFLAKASLFTTFPNLDKKMSIFATGEYGERLLKLCPTAHGFYLSHKEEEISLYNNMLQGKLTKNSPQGLTIEHNYQGKTWILETSLVGEHNAQNVLGVECLALQLGFNIEDLQSLADFSGVPGRLERLRTAKTEAENTHFFVDYAHTPDALIHAQEALRKAGFNRIITVFGCGGDRDRAKRPLMGEAVAKGSDIAIATSDNPRTEDPKRILEDILPGLKEAKQVYTEIDRRQALKLACELAQNGDAVLVAGKGHETYQIIGTTKYPFNDLEILKEFL